MSHTFIINSSVLKGRKRPPAVSSAARARLRYPVSSDAWDDFVAASYEGLVDQLGAEDTSGNVIHTGHLDEQHAIIVQIGDVLFKPTSNDLNHLSPGIYGIDAEADDGYVSLVSSGSAIEYNGTIMYFLTD